MLSDSDAYRLRRLPELRPRAVSAAPALRFGDWPRRTLTSAKFQLETGLFANGRSITSYYDRAKKRYTWRQSGSPERHTLVCDEPLWEARPVLQSDGSQGPA